MRKAAIKKSHGRLSRLGAAGRIAFLVVLMAGSVVAARIVQNDAFSADMGYLMLSAGVVVVLITARDFGVLRDLQQILQTLRGGQKK